MADWRAATWIVRALCWVIDMVLTAPHCACDMDFMLVSGVTKMPSLKGFEFSTFVLDVPHIAASHLFYN